MRSGQMFQANPFQTKNVFLPEMVKKLLSSLAYQTLIQRACVFVI
jgi:hypothetical protein